MDIKKTLKQVNSTYIDVANEVQFTAMGAQNSKQLDIEIKEGKDISWPAKLVGFIMDAGQTVWDEIKDFFRWTSVGDELPIPLPDLDLHVFTEDGRHIGMNYITGEYEVEIPGALVSGDSMGSEEWILLPPDITDYHFVVSSFDIDKFLEAVPEARGLTDGIDNYIMKGVFVDPSASALYATLPIERTLLPGDQLEWLINFSQNPDGTYNVKATATPEPGTFVLLCAGLLMIFLVSRKRLYDTT